MTQVMGNNVVITIGFSCANKKTAFIRANLNNEIMQNAS